MAEHTPGPWLAETPSCKGSWVKGSGGKWTALACGESDENAGANARLIAAAPDMLAALKAFLAAADFEDGEGAKALAADAIAKAEGTDG